MDELPKLDLEVVEIKRMIVTEDAAGGTIVTVEVLGGQIIDLHFRPDASAKLEAFLARASAIQAKRAPLQ